MPASNEILAGLGRLANEWWVIAALWHLVIAAAIAAVALGGWRPSARVAALLASSPAASAALFAWIGGNPFNGAVLAVATLALAAFAARAPRRSAAPGPTWARVVGVGMVGLAWVYPHFLDGPAWRYLVAAPVGLVPCPSLSAVLGAGLCAGAFGSRGWAVVAGLVGLFYGAFGVLRLAVWIDLPLVLGALAMLVLAARTPRAHAPREERSAPGVSLELGADPRGIRTRPSQRLLITSNSRVARTFWSRSIASSSCAT